MTIPDDVEAFLDELEPTRRNRAISETFLELVPWDQLSHNIQPSHLKGVRLFEGNRPFCWVFPKGGVFQFHHPRPHEIITRFPEIEVRPKALNLKFKDVNTARVAAEVADLTLEAMGSSARFLT
jgi:hypothetical protein